jgi:catechol 2,3-dioxygenase-like lactoylglutathione lyase family enzyme
MSNVVEEPTVKFHLSLNVTDLDRAIDFYQVLFGAPPAKRHDDYAKFEVDDPPVVFSLVPRAAGGLPSMPWSGTGRSPAFRGCPAWRRWCSASPWKPSHSRR